MKDEEYLFVSDSRDKKITARSARKRRTHNGKRGSVRFPSDHLTKKELEAMSGECKSYRLNDPMEWKEFRAMPDDLKIAYIKLLREKFNVDNKNLAAMMGVSASHFSKEIMRLGISEGQRSRGHHTKWDREGFLAWRNGVPIPAREEIPVEEPASEMSEEEAAEVPNCLGVVPVVKEEPAAEEKPAVMLPAVPMEGCMTFEGRADQALNTVAVLLGDANVRLRLQWDVLED